MIELDDKLVAWFDGDLDDDDLTDQEIEDLRARVLNAVARKTLARDGVHIFPEHKTVQ